MCKAKTEQTTAACVKLKQQDDSCMCKTKTEQTTAACVKLKQNRQQLHV